jgi:ATP-dependent helicase HrpA
VYIYTIAEESLPATLTGKENLLTMLQRAEDLWREKELPILDKSNEIKSIFRASDRVLLEAETGSGKSTVAPVLLLEELLTVNPNAHIVVTQPRQIASEDLANHVGSKIGERYVGFHHGDKTRLTADTRITYTVEKSLLNKLMKDPSLSEYDAVVLDEIHERSVDLDILMPLLKQTQAARAASGKPLKIVLTSATVDKDLILNYFKGAEHIKVDGKMFDVEEKFLPKEKGGTEKTPKDPADKDEKKKYVKPIDISKIIDKAATTTEQIIREGKEEGDILIFMPGREEVSKTIDLIKQKISDPDIEVIPLLGGKDKTNAYKESTGKRKIIVATNVAETSITIDTVRIVIDSGLQRTSMYDKETGMTVLRTLEHTQSNAQQRKGRAGRTAPGKIYYLFTEDQYKERDTFLPAEILRTNLASQVLQMKAMGINDIYNFDFLEHPGREAIDMAYDSLWKLGALDVNRNLTEIGKMMLEYETDPHFARMLVEAEKRGCLDAVSLLVGLMSNGRRIFDQNFLKGKKFEEIYRRFIVSNSDFLTLLNIWNEYVENDSSKDAREAWSAQNGINTYTLYNAANERRDILHDKRIDKEKIDLSLDAQHAIALCLISGLTDSYMIRGADGYYKLLNGKKTGIEIGNNSVLRNVKPPTIISGAIRTIDKLEKTFADFNMSVNEMLIREAAPYLFPKKEEPKPETPVVKPEAVKPKPAPAEKPTLPPSPAYHSAANLIKPVSPPAPEKKITLKDILLFLPRTVIKTIKGIAKLISKPFIWVYRNMKKLLRLP